jgi:hypothetical protein
MPETASPSPATPESPYRARMCAQFMAAAAVLAAQAPDDFRRRIIARSVFVYAHEFLGWARRAKNDLKSRPTARQEVQRLEPMLERYAEHDYGPYEVVRHRIAAHRQPIGGPGGDQITTAAAWLDITDATVRILAEDARAIWNQLAAGYDLPRLEDFPPVSAELGKALNDAGFESAPSGLVPGVGSFDETRPDAVGVRQGGDLGERLRELVDAVRSVQVLSQLATVVAGCEPYWRVTAAALAAEAATLVDLLYEQPVGTPAEHRHAPLLELLRAEPGAEALPILEHGLATLDQPALADVRRIRNTIGAHVDEHLSVSDLMRELEKADASAFDAVLDNAFATISLARAADLRLGLLRLVDAPLAGLSRLGSPLGPEY